MKTLTKLVLALVLLATVAASHAQWNNGYARTTSTYGSGYQRSTPGYSYSSYSSYGTTPCAPAYHYSPPVSVHGSSTTYGNTTYHNYYNSLGGSLSGTTQRSGNTSYTSLSGW